ncbi:msx2-interacting protein isoform X3 [Oncorhynchus mykiss]|uniref:msx2-interacting protein isoform X3 n=1 Tax=Oncorhynchus mykiss TaxID=8022 RepID=UPI001878A7DF|nr:msx2-interacting protein isoform X3 [Oncorhynchus mykiss]
MVRETRHLWVGNLPEHVREEKIVEHFKRYGRVESVKVLRKRGSEGGVAAFVDFVDIKSAQKAHNAVNKMGDRDLRTDYNEPGSVPSAVRGLDDNPPSSSHGRDVSGFSRGAVGPVFGPPVSIHTREGRYERIRDGSESRERAYDHSPYGHHERGGTFDRQRHYNADYYRDRTMFAAGVSPGPGSAGAMGGSFETPEPHFESRIRGDPFTLSSAARRDPYRDDRGRRVDRTYHRRSRSSHSSQSRHPSPQRTTGQTPKAPHSPKRAPLSPGRGPRSRSRSRSSSSDSVSSTSSTGSGSDSNSSSSDGSHARSVQSSATHAPPSQPCSMVMEGDEPRRSFGIRVQNLPVRSTDTSLKDGLFHEFKKHGKVTSVQIHGALEDRYGLVFFRQQEDQEKALNVSKGKLFFGMMIEVSAWNGPETESENEFRPLDGRIDEFHPKATRTLFIGNLEKTTSYQQLLDIFQRFGEIVDIDIKKVNGVPQYAFVQYSDIVSVCKAIKKMDGEYLGSNRLKLGFGKSMPTTCVWLDGLASNITEQYLTRHFCRYGHVVKVVFDRLKGMALILYNNTDFAQAAVRETKGWKIGGNKIKVDFASQESQMAFYRSMQASGQDIRDFYEIPTERREERPRPPYHEFSAERAYFENARTPGTIYPEDPRRDYPARSRERYSELEHYQGEHFDPRYHEDPREFRDYRDPFEQDIRKYTYIQRERERERERFEADHGMWSPSHPRRPITPSASPSPSERAPRDPERRVYSQSSERSGSCSSLSPPRFDKTDKAPPLEHGASSKSERLEKDIHLVEPERVAGAEKSKRGRRKEKGDKEKGEKSKSRKAKVQSPSIPPSETELEPSLDGGSGRGKVSDQDSLDRQRYKGDNDPPSDPTTSTSRHEPVKSERLESGKGENADKDGKTRSRKHQKSDTGNDGKDPSVDSDRLAARKRRFGDASGRTIRQKRRRLEDEDGSQPQDFGASTAFTKEIDGDRKSQQKDSQRRDSRSKSERLVFLGSHKEGQDPAMRGQEELPEGSMDPMDSKRHSMSRRFSHDGNMDQDNARNQDPQSPFKYGAQDNDKGVKEEPLDIDLSQSYRKQMEQRRLHQQLQEPDKQEKAGSPQGLETEDLEHRSLVHEVGKPPQDVTDHFPSHKLKKLEQFDADISAKRGDRVYRSFRQKSEDPEWHNTASPGLQHFSHHAEQDFAESSHLREVKTEDKSHPDLELAVKRTHTTQMSKPSTPLQLSEEEREKQWESRVKQDFLPDLNFSRGIGKNTHNRKRLEYGILQDLEPGEVRSDSEEDREHKPQSPMPSTSMPFSDGQRVDRFSDPKLATLERMKFYSFALDQTITPDTKALLERAKSLSSSREDNWSFLDYDSHFAGLRSRKDTEKVESAPRPTPSWYMKKKKIRSGGSEDKLDDRKEDPKPKPEEHERRELFASRFLHSSIFEQDSRRLQHLERKHEDPEQSPAQQTGQLGLADGQPDTEPVVLFHSRFLEFTRLQQQKDQQLHEVKRADSVDSNRLEKSLEAEQQPLQFPKTSEPVMDPETKPTSPAENHMISQPPLMPKEMSPPKQMSPPLPPKGMSPPKEMSPPLPPKVMSPPLPPKVMSPPLPPKVMSPPLPPKEMAPPLPPKEMAPPLPPKEMTPPKHTSPPLPPKEMSPPKHTSPPLPPKEMSPPKHTSPPLPPKEMSPPKHTSPPLPPKEMSPPKHTSPPLPPKEMSPPLPPKEMCPPKHTSPPLPPKEMSPPLPPKEMFPPLPPKEMSPIVETHDQFTPEPKGPEPAAPEPLTKENRENEQLPPLLQIPPCEMLTPASVNLVAPEHIRSVRKVKRTPSGEKSEDIAQDIQILNPEQSSSSDCLHETSVSSFVPEPELAAPELPPVFLSSTPPNPVEEMEVSKYDTNTDNTDTHTEVEKKLELNQTQVLVDNETSDESISPPQKSKNKKSKSPTQVPLTPLVSTTSSEKPLTRKSERTKRASSPRAESSKGNSDSKSTGKSPIHGADPEHGTEQSISVGRARRRNVKSVYATPVEEDATKGAGKDVTESPRTARKRGGDKDKEAAPQQPLEQDSLAPITSRRGRPPKNRRQGEDMLTAKGDRSKMETKDTDSNESESSERISKVSKGRHSPHGHKALASQLPMPIATGSSRKGDKTEPPEDVSQQMDFTEDSLAMQNCTVSCKEDTVAPGVTKKEENVKQQLGTEKSRDKDRQKKDPVDEKASVTKFGEKESEPPVVEEQPVLEKMEKSGRGKAPRLTRTPKSPVLKNLKIRLNVTEVKDLLQMGDEEPENGDDSSKKTKPGESTNDPLLESSPGKDVSSSNEDKDESTPETKPPIDPKTLLQQEQELEQAVENIAKLTDPTLPAESPTPLAPPSAELKIDTEEEKSANPASEYELAAAIDSIMGEDIPVPLPQEPVISAVVDSDLEIPSFVQPTKGAEPVSNISPIQGESFFPTTPRKGAKGRAKTPKRSKSQKSNKKDAVKEISSEPENTSVITSDSIPSNSQPVPETIPSTPVAGVITTTSWKPKTEHLAPKATDMPKESKLPPVLTEQPPPQHLKPVCPQTKSPTLPKPQQQPPPPPECISPSLSPPPTRPNIRPTQPSRIPVSPPDWLNQSKDAGVPSSPRASAASFENPAIPSDTEPLETERNNSDLRRILMKHKNVSLPVPCSSSVPSNLGTLSLRDPPHLPESNTPMVAVTSKTSLNDNRPHPAQPVVRPPASLPSPESKSVISVIASTATSVISRVCNPPDMEKVNMSVDRNPIVDMPLPKQTYRPPSMEDRDSGSYHGPSVGEEGGSAGRYLVESSGLGTGSSPGLRVNTSEGVVVLSHSGQIKEGPQRISAKISQIPPATVVDMESQQLVSMPQIKQEMYTHSQSNTPKCPPIQTDHGHLKTQQTVSSIKQENTGMEKLESPYPSGPQGGVVKRLQQTVGNPQGMGYHHSEFTMLLKHPKKVDGADAMNADGCKPSWTSAISPAMSLPSPAGNHVGFVPGSATDRTPSHLSGVKQEPRSPRKLGHPHSPFTKVSSPIGSSSPKGLPGMLPSSLPAMQQYVTSVHHPEQSVIMQPHSAHGGIGRMSPHRASQAIPMGHLVQGEVRVNTPPLSVMSFGMHGDPLVSPWSGPLQQRPTSPQAVGRDIVLKVNPGNVRGHEGEQDDARRFHQATGRQSATQLKAETMQPDPRGALLSGLQLDPYMSPRDLRVLMHHPQGERSAPEPHQGHIQETVPPSSTSTNITSSMSPRAHLLAKGVSEKDVTKPQEVKRPHSPPKDGMMGFRPSMAAMASPQRVQLLPSGTGASFSEYPGIYTNTRAIHSQITETSPFGINQVPLNITSALGADPSQSQADVKVKQVGQQPVNMVQLLTKYPIVWQGLLALKNDQAAVQLHFVCGNKGLALRSLPLPEGGSLLRIVQRMRLEASQLDGVARRMTQGESEFCLLLALPCGRDQEDVLNQTQALRTAFINYLQAKLAAGIINVPNPGSNQPAYVLQIFPPCEFSESHLSRLAPDLLNRISNISPHLMIVITSV